jgi:hypothetical protein
MTLLYLVKQACVASGETGALVNTDDAVADIGLAALMANDLMLPFMPSNRDGPLERLANLFPFSDYISTDGYATEIARGQKMFELASQLASLPKRNDFVDITSRAFRAEASLPSCDIVCLNRALASSDPSMM